MHIAYIVIISSTNCCIHIFSSSAASLFNKVSVSVTPRTNKGLWTDTAAVATAVIRRRHARCTITSAICFSIWASQSLNMPAKLLMSVTNHQSLPNSAKFRGNVEITRKRANSVARLKIPRTTVVPAHKWWHVVPLITLWHIPLYKFFWLIIWSTRSRPITDILLWLYVWYAWCLGIQPEVVGCVETTVSDINIPVEVIGCDIRPTGVQEPLSLSR